MWPIKVIAREYYKHTHQHSVIFGALHNLLKDFYHTEGCRFVLKKELFKVGFQTRFFFDTYEKPERILINRHLNRSGSVLELGACLGVVSCISNKKLLNPDRHVVVEANPTLIPVIEENRKINNCQFQIYEGLVSKSSSGDFYLHELVVGASTLRQTSQMIKCSVITLNELERKYQIVFDTLIMDIEGGEFSFIEENIDDLKRRFRQLFIEFHDFILTSREIELCRAMLTTAGFQCIEKIGNTEYWENRNL